MSLPDRTVGVTGWTPKDCAYVHVAITASTIIAIQKSWCFIETSVGD
jgi:hypothetical protein